MTDPEDESFDPDCGPCVRCGGEGIIMICIDDMCRGCGECPFNPPLEGCYAICPECKGEM